MGFLDSLSQGTQAVADKLKNVSDSASISSRITKEQDSLAYYYSELGKAYYKNHKDAPEADVAEICKYIDQTIVNIANLEAEKDRVNGVMRCPQCATELPANSRFCTGCGYKFQAAEEAPQSTAQKPAFCSNCGTPTTPGSAFCSNCGSKI